MASVRDHLPPARGDGGYEDGYAAVDCFWGTEPGSLVRALCDQVDVSGRNVLDVGAGEGKNTVYLAARGARVTAVELSLRAAVNRRKTFGTVAAISWIEGDILDVHECLGTYDVVVAYGLFHCLASPDEVHHLIRALQAMTVPGGWHVVCAFNDRAHNLSAHPGFAPCLLPHADYLMSYANWRLIQASDADLHETHPHNHVPHSHSMTRIIAQKP